MKKIIRKRFNFLEKFKINLNTEVSQYYLIRFILYLKNQKAYEHFAGAMFNFTKKGRNNKTDTLRKCPTCGTLYNSTLSPGFRDLCYV